MRSTRLPRRVTILVAAGFSRGRRKPLRGRALAVGPRLDSRRRCVDVRRGCRGRRRDPLRSVRARRAGRGPRGRARAAPRDSRVCASRRGRRRRRRSVRPTVSQRPPQASRGCSTDTPLRSSMAARARAWSTAAAPRAWRAAFARCSRKGARVALSHAPSCSISTTRCIRTARSCSSGFRAVGRRIARGVRGLAGRRCCARPASCRHRRVARGRELQALCASLRAAGVDRAGRSSRPDPRAHAVAAAAARIAARADGAARRLEDRRADQRDTGDPAPQGRRARRVGDSWTRWCLPPNAATDAASRRRPRFARRSTGSASSAERDGVRWRRRAGGYRRRGRGVGMQTIHVLALPATGATLRRGALRRARQRRLGTCRRLRIGSCHRGRNRHVV